MKLYTKFLSVFALSVVALITSCTGDLNVDPIDPNLDTPNKVLQTENNYKQLLAKCYSALSVSSPDGSSGDPDISGIDGGFGQYLRALYNLNELTTDEAVIGWNDQTVKDLHGLSWSSSDVFIAAMYGRLFYQIALCSEVVRQINSSGLTTDNMKTFAAEARCLRALSYYHAIDMFGNVPFITEDQAIGGANPERISRADLFKWLTETEIPGFIDDLKDGMTNEHYRADKGLAEMILAKLYLNAEVYTGTAMYDKCAEACNKIIAMGYSLEPVYSNLFKGDNDKCLDNEIIFSVYQDEYNTQAYGGTTYLMLG
ncbi:MAG: RagB/SusD family nutrient uptake outer membrane protein, partial [Bacteroidaceae bacterium]